MHQSYSNMSGTESSSVYYYESDRLVDIGMIDSWGLS